MANFDLAQNLMLERGIDGWLVSDYRGSNPVFRHLLGYAGMTTRRDFLYVPARGEIRLLLNFLDRDLFEGIGYEKEIYRSYAEMTLGLRKMLKGKKTVAMEYSPKGGLPMISWVDGGTMELVRDFGASIVSSADLFQTAAAVWTHEQLKSHRKAAESVVRIKDEAFDMIRKAIAAGGSITEYDVKRFIMEQFAAAGMKHSDGPTVAAGSNSGSPHYEPSEANHSPIKSGDTVLIDLWARYSDESDIFGDITWVGYVGEELPSRYQEVFNIVKGARDIAFDRLRSAWDNKEEIAGYQIDDVARGFITDAGYGDYFAHRTGHSLGGGDHPHGYGANLDNFETHDTRLIFPGTGFTIEPGIYLPEFGVRLEINIYVDPMQGPGITTPVQNEIIRL